MTDSDAVVQQEKLPEIPGYQILGELGRGGMGVVYRALQTSRNRLVALKMILSGRGAGFFDLARFRVEAEAVACLQHPNIIRIHDVGVHGGCPYFALEFAEGGSLARPAQGRTHPPRWAAEVVWNLAQAIQLAHNRGILHRDLKPANVLLMADGTPKISDFGLAKFERPIREVSELYCTMTVSALDSQLFQFMRDYEERKVDGEKPFEDYVIERTWQQVMGSPVPGSAVLGLAKVKEFISEATKQASTEPPPGVSSLLGDLSRAGAIMGSPHYMAPEQARGDNHGIGPPTDIYALGAVLYHLLTGRPPLQGNDLWQVLDKVQTQPPPSIQPQVNRELEAICFKCLEKRVERRYESAADLAEDLQRFLDGYSALAEVDLREEGRPSPERASSRDVPNTHSDLGSSQHADPYKTKSWWQFWK